MDETGDRFMMVLIHQFHSRLGARSPEAWAETDGLVRSTVTENGGRVLDLYWMAVPTVMPGTFMWRILVIFEVEIGEDVAWSEGRAGTLPVQVALEIVRAIAVTGELVVVDSNALSRTRDFDSHPGDDGKNGHRAWVWP